MEKRTKITKICIKCGRTMEVEDFVIQSCFNCKYGLWYKFDIDLLIGAGWTPPKNFKIRSMDD